jgi:hypothetical protein
MEGWPMLLALAILAFAWFMLPHGSDDDHDDDPPEDGHAA